MTAHKAIVDLPQPGERVRIHPACDWFMRGEKYAEVLRTENSERIHVRGERSGKKFVITQANVIAILP